MGDRLVKIQNKKAQSKAQVSWKTARSDERWERRADRQMLLFSAVSVLLPSQITHLRQNPSESSRNDVSEDAGALLSGERQSGARVALGDGGDFFAQTMQICQVGHQGGVVSGHRHGHHFVIGRQAACIGGCHTTHRQAVTATDFTQGICR